MDSLDTGLVHDDKTFEGITYTGKVIRGREFQSCFFKKCDLSNRDFSHNKFLDCTFQDCNLSFSQANIAGSVFNECDLSGAIFNRTDLTAVNFVTAYNYNIEPELNIIKNASFSSQGLAGLLSKYQIKIV